MIDSSNTIPYTVNDTQNIFKTGRTKANELLSSEQTDICNERKFISLD